MLGLFRRRRPDAEGVRRIKALVAAQLGLAGTTTITVAELRCHEPGCQPVETAITARDADGRARDWRIPKPIAEIGESDVAGLAAGSDG